jgi:signal transduction histidine kinase
MLRSRLTGEPQDVDEQFAVLTSEVTRLDRVVRTFLDFNRPVQVRLEKVDLAEATAEVIAFIEPEAVMRRIRTSFDRPERPIIIEADRDLLRQALLNIAVNAIEAMEGAERDGVEVQGELRIHLEPTEDSCVVAIADTGPGIPSDQREKIFQLYYTTRPQGTGIGLAMAFRAAQLHGGTIEVNSEMGKGTEFRIVLPLIDSGKRPAASGQAA